MKILLTIFICLFSFLGEAQITFQKVYNDSGITSAYDIITTYDGGYAVTGFKTCGYFGCMDFFLLKIDSLGTTQWVRLYDGGFNNDDGGYSLVQTSDSGFAITGYVSTPPNLGDNVRILKTDKNGNKLWDKNIGGLGCQDGWDIENTFDNGFIIASEQDTGGICNEIEVELIKIDSLGNIEWQKQYYGTGLGRAVAVKQTSDSGYVATGVTQNMLSSTSNEDIFLLRTDKNGNTLWTKIYGGEGAERGEDVIVSSDGGFVIAGYTQGFFNANQVAAYVIKTDSVGDTLWTKVYEKGNQNDVRSIVGSGSNEYVLVGSVSYPIPPYTSNYYLLKIDNSGNKIWEKEFISQINVSSNARALTLSNDGGYAMCGLSSATIGKVFIVKTDSNGLMVGINNYYHANGVNLSVYPNPFHNYTTINLDKIYKYGSDNISMELYDITGKLLFQQQVNEPKITLYNQGFAKGMYLLTIKNKQQIIATKKIIIN